MCKGPGYSFYTWQMSWCGVYNQTMSLVQENRRIPCSGVIFCRIHLTQDRQVAGAHLRRDVVEVCETIKNQQLTEDLGGND